MTTHQTGRAGKFSRKMQLRSLLRATGWAVATVCVAALALLLLAHHNYQGALFLAVVAAVCGATSHHHLGRADKQNIGAKSEQQVAAALAKAGCFYVLNNVHGDELERGDLTVEAADLGRLDQTGKGATVQDEIDPVRDLADNPLAVVLIGDRYRC
jgi:hypothetical protein